MALSPFGRLASFIQLDKHILHEQSVFSMQKRSDSIELLSFIRFFGRLFGQLFRRWLGGLSSAAFWCRIHASNGTNAATNVPDGVNDQSQNHSSHISAQHGTDDIHPKWHALRITCVGYTQLLNFHACHRFHLAPV